MPQQFIPVLSIIGPVGIGKTSVAFAVSDIFNFDFEQPIPHSLIDLDDVRRSWPAPDYDRFNMALGFKNLHAVWQNYYQSGSRCLIIPSVMESPDDFESIRRAVPGAEIFVVRLEASLQINHQRIRARETTAKSLDWYLKRATQLAKELSEKKLEHLLIDTADKSPKVIAQEILTHWKREQI